MVWTLLAASEATTASKQPRRSNRSSDLKSVTPITFISMCMLLNVFWAHFVASEATTASKQPQKSILTSDLKSVTSITYISMCILLTCFGPLLRPFWWPQRPLQPPNGLGTQILPQIWNLWPKPHMMPCLSWLLRPLFVRWRKED